MAVMGVWAFIFVTDTDDNIKQKNKKPWKHTKQIFPEQKTKKSFALHHLCPVHEVLTGIWNPLISAQIVNSFGQGKCTFDCQSGNLKNYASGNHVSTSSCMLRIEKLITFNITYVWTFHTNRLFQKKSPPPPPPTEGTVFWPPSPLPTEFPKLLEPALPGGFPSSKSPHKYC